MNDVDTATKIESKLDAIIILLAAPQVKDMTIAEAADKLSKMGIERDVIAAVCNTTPETVRVAMFKAKKKLDSKPQQAVSKGRKVPS